MRIENIYLWLDYTSSTGSRDSKLLMAKDNVIIRDLIQQVNQLDPMKLYHQRPKWMIDVTQIRCSIQLIRTGKTLYSITWDVEIHYPCVINQVFREERIEGYAEYIENQSK